MVAHYFIVRIPKIVGRSRIYQDYVEGTSGRNDRTFIRRTVPISNISAVVSNFTVTGIAVGSVAVGILIGRIRKVNRIGRVVVGLLDLGIVDRIGNHIDHLKVVDINQTGIVVGVNQDQLLILNRDLNQGLNRDLNHNPDLILNPDHNLNLDHILDHHNHQLQQADLVIARNR